MTFTLLGIAGKAGVGKDTAADHLCDHHGFVRYAFADPLRAGLRTMLGLTNAHFTDRTLKEQPVEPYGVSPRHMMQTLGTEWGRQHIHPELWLLVAGRILSDIESRGAKRVVITDLRFENEADWVRKQGGTVLHILRPGTGSVASHSSEAGITQHDRDLWLINDGTIAELRFALNLVVTGAA